MPTKPLRRLPLALAITSALLGSAHLLADPGETAARHLERAAKFAADGALPAAIIEFKNALQIDPGNAQTRLELAKVYLRNSDGSAAEKELQQAEIQGVAPATLLIPLGDALLLQGEYERVLDEITPEALATPPSPQDLAQVLRQRGDAAALLGRLPEACDDYGQAKAQDPTQAAVYRGLAHCALAAQAPADALALLDEALRLDNSDAQTWIAIGNLRRSKGEWPGAIEAYSGALKNDPNRVDALFYRALIQALNQQTQPAQADLKRLQTLAPGYFGTAFVEALLSIQAKDVIGAKEALQRTLAANPNFGPAKLLSARLDQAAGANEQAAETLRTYLLRNPDDQEARKQLAALLLTLKDPAQALDVVAPALRARTPDTESLLIAAEAKRQREGGAAALPLLKQAEQQAPDDASIRTSVGLSRLAAGDTKGGLADLEAAAAGGDGDQRAAIALAYQYLGAKRYDEALRVLEKLERKTPQNAGIFNLKGQAYQGLGDKAQARASFTRALDLRPTLASAAVRLAQLDLEGQDFAAARNRYNTILKQDKQSVPAMVGLAEVAGRTGNDQERLQWLQQAAAVSPRALVPRLMLARYYADKGNLPQALEYAKAATEARPGLADTWALLGELQLRDHQAPEAVATFQKLTQLNPKAPGAYARLGLAELERGDKGAARRALREALDLDPQNPDALRIMRDLEERSGNHAQAQKYDKTLQASGGKAGAAGDDPEHQVRIALSGATGPAEDYKPAVAKAAASLTAIKQHRALLKSSREKDADQALLAWLAKHPDDRMVRGYLAGSYLERQREQDAIAQFETLVQQTPEDPDILNNLAVLYQRRGDSRSLDLARKAYRLKPDSPAYADTLGWIQVQQHQDAAAGVRLLEQAAAAAPKDPEIHLHLGEALIAAGQKRQAIEVLDTLSQAQLSPAQERQRRKLLERLQ